MRILVSHYISRICLSIYMIYIYLFISFTIVVYINGGLVTCSNEAAPEYISDEDPRLCDYG